MHLTVERPALAAALKLATTAAGKIGAASISLRATPGRLTVAAQGWDRAIDATIPADVHTAGTVAVPGHLIAEWAASDRAAEIEVSTNEALAKLRGSRELSVKTLPDALEESLHPADGPSATLPREEFVDVLRRLAGCVSDDPFLPKFQAVELAFGGGRLVAYATHRYVVGRVILAIDGHDEFTVTPPHAALLAATSGLEGDEITLTADGGTLWLSDADQATHVRLSTLEDPAWVRLDHILAVEESHTLTTILTSADLRREVVSVTKLDRLAGARTPQIHLTAQENVGLWVESDQGKDELAGLSTGAVLAYEGDEIDGILNPAYLLAALDVVKAETVRVRHRLPVGVSQLKPLSLTDPAASPRLVAQACVMPIRKP